MAGPTLRVVAPGAGAQPDPDWRTSPTLRLDQAAQLLQISVWTARRLVQRGEWPTRVLRLGRAVRVPTAELLSYLGRPPDPEVA